MNLIKLQAVFLVSALIMGCSGVRTTGQSFSTHAENFNFLYMQFPGGDTHERALALVPEGGQVDTFFSTPHDNSSFIGVISRLLGVEYTSITGRIVENEEMCEP